MAVNVENREKVDLDLGLDLGLDIEVDLGQELKNEKRYFIKYINDIKRKYKTSI